MSATRSGRAASGRRSARIAGIHARVVADGRGRRAPPGGIGLLLRARLDRDAGRPDRAGRAGARAARAVRRRRATARAHHARPEGGSLALLRATAPSSRRSWPSTSIAASGLSPRHEPRLELRVARPRRRRPAAHRGRGGAGRAAAGVLSRQRLYIADGHHRYETALAYQAEVRPIRRWPTEPPGALAVDWIMAVLVNAEMEEVDIRPPIGSCATAVPMACRHSSADPGPVFRAEPMEADDVGERLDGARRGRGDLWPAAAGRARLPAVRRPGRGRRADAARAGEHRGRAAGLAILHAALLDDRLGIDAEAVAAGDRLAYTRDEADARRRSTPARRRPPSWSVPPGSNSSRRSPWRAT